MITAHGLQQFLRNGFFHIDSVSEKGISKIHFRNNQLPFIESESRLPPLIGIQFAQ
jgi:hypothetical protein